MSDETERMDDVDAIFTNDTMADPADPVAEAVDAPAPCPCAPACRPGVPDELRERLVAVLSDLQQATGEHESAKEAAKAARAELDAAQSRMARVAREVSDVLEGKATAKLFDAEGEPTPEAAQEEPPDPEKLVAPILVLGLSEALNGLLYAANIETVDDVWSLMFQHGEFWAQDIKGLGGERAAKVGTAVNKHLFEYEE